MKSPRGWQNFYYITTLDSQTNNCPEHALLEDKIFPCPFSFFSQYFRSECDENIKPWLNIYFDLSLSWETIESLIKVWWDSTAGRWRWGVTPHWIGTTHSLRWLREYFLFSFIKPRGRQKSAWQTRVRRFTAKEMGKSFIKTHFIWNTLSKITKSCVFLPHNPFISYLDKKSYFFLILDILPSSDSSLHENKILRKTFNFKKKTRLAFVRLLKSVQSPGSLAWLQWI